MPYFAEYLRQNEPEKSAKAEIWQTAIGLQAVDQLQISGYLLETADEHINGEIDIAQVKQRIDGYYQQKIVRTENRHEEADKVAARIAELLSEEAFSLSPIEYLTIHKRLFQGIYDFAGVVREYNISKKEWVLNGESVTYGSADSLLATLEYDLAQEKKFRYQGLNPTQIVAHLAQFTAYLWQIHLFGEGNTRTTAVFLIKYLRQLGFKQVNNTMFAEHSWFFRNALVRANYQNLAQGITSTDQFLIHFLENLLLGKHHPLSNRAMRLTCSDKDK